MIAIDSEVFDKCQQDAYDKIVAENGGIVWMNVGDGKTRVALMAAAVTSMDYPVVVVVCRRAAFYDWEQEIATLQLGWRVWNIEDIPNNFMFIESRKNVVLVSDGKLLNPVVQDILRHFHVTHQFGTMILDEGWLFKNPKSEKHKVVRRYAELHPTILISGSMMTARNITDIFGQVAACGRASALGRTMTNFREKYMTGIAGNYFSWYPKPGAYKQIIEAIEPFTYIHMPEVKARQSVERILKVKPTEQQLEYFIELKSTASLEDKFELKNMANVVTKAQQISNGWFQRDDGEFEDFPSPKIDRCQALVEEIIETGQRVVVWCAFRYDIERLTLALGGLSEIATLQSGQPFNQKLWQSSDCRICLATEASGSSVNHFAQVPYGIYFSQDFKWHSLQQSQGRHTRRSSLHNKAYFTFLHTEKSLDAQVYYTVKTSQSSERSVIRQMDVAQWLKGER